MVPFDVLYILSVSGDIQQGLMKKDLLFNPDFEIRIFFKYYIIYKFVFPNIALFPPQNF